MEYKKCKIKWKVIENSTPDFGKFLATEKMDFIFFSAEHLKNRKKVKFGDKEICDFFVNENLGKNDRGDFIARFLGDLDDMIVVEPYIEDENGNYLSDYKNFSVMVMKSYGNHAVIHKGKPDMDTYCLLYADIREHWYIEKEGHYYLHNTSSTMDMDMRAFCFRNANNDLIEYCESFIKKQKQIEEDNERELYLKLKNKFEPTTA